MTRTKWRHGQPRKGFKAAREERLHLARAEFEKESDMSKTKAKEAFEAYLAAEFGAEQKLSDTPLGHMVLIDDVIVMAARESGRVSELVYLVDLKAGRFYRRRLRGSNKIESCPPTECIHSAWIMKALASNRIGREWLERTGYAPWKVEQKAAEIVGVPKHHSKQKKRDERAARRSDTGKVEVAEPTPKKKKRAKPTEFDMSLIDVNTNTKKVELIQQDHEVTLTRNELVKLLRSATGKQIPKSLQLFVADEDGKRLAIGSTEEFSIRCAWSTSEERTVEGA